MKPFRREKVASRVQEIVSETLAFRLTDPRIEPMTSVTRVEVTGDLLVAKVYFSVMGGDAAERRTIRAIRHAGGFIQRAVAQELNIRQCPELRFEIDERAKKIRHTLELLEKNRQEKPELFADLAEGRAAPAEPTDAGFDEDDDSSPEPDSSEEPT